MEKVFVTIPEAQAALGLGRMKLYELIASGELPVARFGRSVRIPSAAIEDLARRHMEDAQEAKAAGRRQTG